MHIVEFWSFNRCKSYCQNAFVDVSGASNADSAPAEECSAGHHTPTHTHASARPLFAIQGALPRAAPQLTFRGGLEGPPCSWAGPPVQEFSNRNECVKPNSRPRAFVPLYALCMDSCISGWPPPYTPRFLFLRGKKFLRILPAAKTGRCPKAVLLFQFMPHASRSTRDATRIVQRLLPAAWHKGIVRYMHSSQYLRQWNILIQVSHQTSRYQSSITPKQHGPAGPFCTM